jgi:hypothetical protein
MRRQRINARRRIALARRETIEEEGCPGLESIPGDRTRTTAEDAFLTPVGAVC